MTDVAFHFNVEHTLPYACRLLRKAVSAGARVLVVGEGPMLQALDRELWTFAPLEFVAHCRAGAAAEVLASSPVVLAESAMNPRVCDLALQVLLNLGPSVPEGYERFARLIEIVNYDEGVRLGARQRWKHYAGLGLQLTRHDLATSQKN